MSDNRNRGITDFKKYDSMATEELEEILRLDADAPEGEESDVDAILYILEVLANREKNTPGKTVQESFASFKENYLREEDEMDSVPNCSSSKPVRTISWIRRATAAAAIFVFVLLGSVKANAFGLKDIWNWVVQWTSETFHFVDLDQENVGGMIENDNLVYSTLQEALIRNFTDPIQVPTWIPEGYELFDIIIQDSPLQRVYSAIYMKADKILKIQVQSYLEQDPEEIEQSGTSFEPYLSNGVEYFIFFDNNNTKATWIDKSFSCYISGELSIEEITTMINSIERG